MRNQLVFFQFLLPREGMTPTQVTKGYSWFFSLSLGEDVGTTLRKWVPSNTCSNGILSSLISNTNFHWLQMRFTKQLMKSICLEGKCMQAHQWNFCLTITAKSDLLASVPLRNQDARTGPRWMWILRVSALRPHFLWDMYVASVIKMPLAPYLQPLGLLSLPLSNW